MYWFCLYGQPFCCLFAASCAGRANPAPAFAYGYEDSAFSRLSKVILRNMSYNKKQFAIIFSTSSASSAPSVSNKNES
jgi:hypothetical protein